MHIHVCHVEQENNSLFFLKITMVLFLPQEIMSKLNKGTGNYFDLGRKRDSLESMVTKDLKPKLEQAEINVQNHMGKITAARQYYMAASKKCKDAQDIIDRESKEVSLLKTELDNKFEEVRFYCVGRILVWFARTSYMYIYLYSVI